MVHPAIDGNPRNNAMTLLTIPELSTRTVVINDPELRMCYQLTVPARSEEDA